MVIIVWHKDVQEVHGFLSSKCYKLFNMYVWIQDSFLQDGELKSELSRKIKELSQLAQDKQKKIESLKAEQNELEMEKIRTHKAMKLICAKYRTELVSKEMKKDYKAGMKVSDLRMG